MCRSSSSSFRSAVTHLFVTHRLSHTSLITHNCPQLPHTPSFTHSFVTYLFVTHHLSRTTLSQHTPLSHTHTHFVTHHLSHTTLSHTSLSQTTLSHTTLPHTTLSHTHSVTHHLSHTLAQNNLCELSCGMHLTCTCKNTPVIPDRNGSVNRPEKKPKSVAMTSARSKSQIIPT